MVRQQWGGDGHSQRLLAVSAGPAGWACWLSLRRESQEQLEAVPTGQGNSECQTTGPKTRRGRQLCDAEHVYRCWLCSGLAAPGRQRRLRRCCKRVAMQNRGEVTCIDHFDPGASGRADGIGHGRGEAEAAGEARTVHTGGRDAHAVSPQVQVPTRPTSQDVERSGPDSAARSCRKEVA